MTNVCIRTSAMAGWDALTARSTDAAVEPVYSAVADPKSGPTKTKEPSDDAGRCTTPNNSLGHLKSAEVRQSTTET